VCLAETANARANFKKVIGDLSIHISKWGSVALFPKHGLKAVFNAQASAYLATGGFRGMTGTRRYASPRPGTAVKR